MAQTITNKFNLPKTLVDACKYDTHRVGGDISVSQLIDAPQIRLLKRDNDYETDVIDNIYALMGTALHHILERANIKSVRKRAFLLTYETLIKHSEAMLKDTALNQIEANVKKANQLKACAKYLENLIPVLFPEIGERYIFEVTLRMDFGDTTLYGTFDLYDKETGILYDYKFTSTFSWTYPESRKKWERQTNVYAFMLRQTKNLPINGIRVVAFFRDWNEYSLNRNNKDYPDRQIKEMAIEMYNDDKIMSYIKSRLDLHKRAMSGENIPCDGSERWAKMEQFAVKTPKSKKALRLLDSEAACIAFIEENRSKYDKMYIERRPGESMRCAKFCSVASVCNQRKEEIKKQLQYEKDNGYSK